MVFRLRAFSIHLGISFFLALLALAVVFLVWYPSPLAGAVGVSDIFLMMLGVDVALGPALTLIVAKKGKPSLPFDLAVIALVQMGALIYGMHSIAVARPAWLVFSGYRFDLVQANSLEDKYLVSAVPAYQSVSWSGPRWVTARMPSDAKKRNELVTGVVAGGPDLPQRPDLYAPIESDAALIEARARPLEELKKFNSIDQVDAKRAKWPEADAWLPLMSKGKALVVFFSRKDAKRFAIVDLRPF